jgi:uncharacterized protein (TIGR02147 family)
MEKLSVFAFQDYRSFLHSSIQAQPEQWGLIAKMAKAANCQRPYLSKVLKGDAHLTPAQGYGLTQFWKMTSDETDYFMSLLEAERAGSPRYREYILRKAQTLKKSHEDLAKRVKRESAVIENEQIDYYSSWHWVAIHVLVSIPEYQTIEAICRRLSLAPHLVEYVLRRLETLGFVRRESEKWRFVSHDRHIPRGSPLVAFHHSNWRHRAILDAQDPNNDSVHFTVVQSLSRSDYEQVKQLVLDFIEKASKIAGPSKKEEMMCLSCDLFKP